MTLDLSVLVEDLALVGLRYVAACEGCTCMACRALDTQFDVDLVAQNQRGRPVLVAYRRQTDYEYKTITIRSRSDRGNRDVQLAKLMDHRSLADLYLQSYPDWLMSCWSAELSKAVAQPYLWCPHPRHELPGSGGQAFLRVCEQCAPVHLHLRKAAA